MKLQAGDKIWVTKRDGEARGGEEDFNLEGSSPLFVEWDGTLFRGCMVAKLGRRAYWTLHDMRLFQEEMQATPDARTNIDCMFEQLEAEGAFA